jgi:very-short-patch-repair endonuclease
MIARKTIAAPQARRAPSPQRGEGWGEGVPASKRKVGLAKRLRRGQTDAERTLWFQLRDRRLNGWKFKRQVQVDRYIVDFVCAEARLIIELDGGQHAASSEYDAARTKVLEAMGYLVLRFWNNDVLQNVNGVLESVVDTVNQQAAVTPSP